MSAVLIRAAGAALAVSLALDGSATAPAHAAGQTGARWGLAAANTAVDPAALQAALKYSFSSRGIYMPLAGARYPNSLVRKARRQGAQIYLNINSWRVVNGKRVCISWGGIAAGKHDLLLVHWAREIVAFGQRNLIISFHHEPSLIGHPEEPSCGTAAQYRAAFAHVRAVFLVHGVTAPFVWTMMASSFHVGDARLYQPKSFDILGVDGYNRNVPWKSFLDVFGAAHKYAVRLGKPLLLAEVGTVERPSDPRAKARWYVGAANRLAGWGDVIAVEWSDSGEYRPDTSSKSLTGWVAASRVGGFILSGA